MKLKSQHLVDAIRLLKPTSEFVLSNNDYSTIQWHVLEGIAPTQLEINIAIEQIKANDIAANVKAVTDKAALLTRLGITADEAKLLLS